MKHPLLFQAIISLRPDAIISVLEDHDTEAIVEVHNDTVLPSDEEIIAECQRMEAAGMTFGDYRKNRELEYPPLGDQLDALFHAGAFPEDMAAKLAAVKAAHPKPE